MHVFKNITLFHGKMNGDIDGDHFLGDAVYFADNPDFASVYAEHKADSEYPGCDYELMGITVFPVLVTFNNPAIASRDFLLEIGPHLNIDPFKLNRFADDFEDSCSHTRNSVFDWLRQQGYDGVILPNDMMPVTPGGDWTLHPSYVSFYPKEHVRFKIGEPTEQDALCDFDIDSYRYDFDSNSEGMRA